MSKLRTKKMKKHLSRRKNKKNYKKQKSLIQKGGLLTSQNKTEFYEELQVTNTKEILKVVPFKPEDKYNWDFDVSFKTNLYLENLKLMQIYIFGLDRSEPSKKMEVLYPSLMKYLDDANSPYCSFLDCSSRTDNFNFKTKIESLLDNDFDLQRSKISDTIEEQVNILLQKVIHQIKRERSGMKIYYNNVEQDFIYFILDLPILNHIKFIIIFNLMVGSNNMINVFNNLFAKTNSFEFLAVPSNRNTELSTSVEMPEFDPKLFADGNIANFSTNGITCYLNIDTSGNIIIDTFNVYTLNFTGIDGFIPYACLLDHQHKSINVTNSINNTCINRGYVRFLTDNDTRDKLITQIDGQPNAKGVFIKNLLTRRKEDEDIFAALYGDSYDELSRSTGGKSKKSRRKTRRRRRRRRRSL